MTTSSHQNKKCIFVIDDDADMVAILTDLLEEDGYVVHSETNPVKGFDKIKKHQPDLLLTDVRMDGMTGLDLCKKMKADPDLKDVMIIMLSTKTAEADVVVGLELGADDYIHKPVRRAELLTRVKTAFRRRTPASETSTLKIGPLEMDQKTYIATINGKKLDLRVKEFELLYQLARREGQVVTRMTLTEAVWGQEHLTSSHTIESHMYELRQKLGKHGAWIEALRGIGYRFEVAD